MPRTNTYTQCCGRRSPHTMKASSPKRKQEHREACVSLSSLFQAMCFALGWKGEEQEEEEAAETQGLDALMPGLPSDIIYGKRSSQTAQTSAPKRRVVCASPTSVRDLSLDFEREGEEEQQQEAAETEGLVDLVGTRIRVWWTDEKAWYAGLVTSVGLGASGSLHTIAYDDGAHATHYLLSAESALNEAWEPEEPLAFFGPELRSSMPQPFGASKVVRLRVPAAAALPGMHPAAPES